MASSYLHQPRSTSPSAMGSSTGHTSGNSTVSTHAGPSSSPFRSSSPTELDDVDRASHDAGAAAAAGGTWTSNGAYSGTGRYATPLRATTMDDRLPQGPTTGSRPTNQWGSPGEPWPPQSSQANMTGAAATGGGRLGAAAIAANARMQRLQQQQQQQQQHLPSSSQAFDQAPPRAPGIYSQHNHSSPSLAVSTAPLAGSGTGTNAPSPLDPPVIPFIPSLDDINLGLESMHFSQKPPRGAASRESQDRYSVTSASTSSSVVPSPSPGADGAMEIKGRGAGHTASVYSVDSIYSDPSATGRVGGVGAEAEWNTTHSRQASSASGRPSLSGSGRRSSAGAGVDTRRTSGVSSVLDQYGGERWASDDGASGSLPYDDHYRDVPQDIQTPLASSMYSASAASSMYGGGSDYFASSSPGPGHAQAQQQQQQQQPYQQHVQPQYYSDGTPYYSEDPRHRPVPSQQFASYGGTSSLPQQAYHQQQQQQAPSFQPQPMHGGWSYEQAGAAIAQNPYYAAATGQLGFPGEPALHRAPSSASSMSMGPAASLNRSQSSLHVPGGGATAAPGIRRKPTSGSTGSGHSTSSGPPITKQSVDDYRQRIKADPDPEAQFNFAKYLIEAAKKITTSASGDEKHAKKYRDALLAESLKLIKRLATQSTVGKPAYADAQFFLANCLGNGSLGLQVDHEKAYNLYVQASKQNHSSATYRTAVCNEVGAGTRRDHPRAVLFYRKASALGDTAGMYKLGMILLNGLLGQQRNPREAVAWLRRAASQADEDNPHALHELGLLYEKPPPPNGGPTLVPYDPAQARELFTQAGQFGYPPSQFKLGSCYEYGSLTCPVDPRRSIAWYTRAAERGDAESELALSGWYLTGSEGVLKQSDSEAYLWARRAANKGLPKAEYAVGYYSEVGIGVKQDLEEAKRWYMRSAAQGNKRAMQRLTELKKLGAEKGRGAKKSTARPTRQEAATECVVS